MATALLAVALTSVLAWLIGTQITYRWDEVKRRRELDLAAVANFYKCYGAFLKVWRIWNSHKIGSAYCPAPTDVQWQCLQSASEVEGDLEGLLIKIVSERRLNDRDLELLGCFREALHCLRERIREDKPLAWFSRTAENSPEFRQYQAFKTLAMYLAGLLQYTQEPWVFGPRRKGIPSEAERIKALLAITAGTLKRDWLVTAERELSLRRSD